MADLSAAGCQLTVASAVAPSCRQQTAEKAATIQELHLHISRCEHAVETGKQALSDSEKRQGAAAEALRTQLAAQKVANAEMVLEVRQLKTAVAKLEAYRAAAEDKLAANEAALTALTIELEAERQAQVVAESRADAADERLRAAERRAEDLLEKIRAELDAERKQKGQKQQEIRQLQV